MKILKISLTAVVAVFGLWFLAFGFRNAAQASGSLKPAKQIYAQSCARCHGADGRGQTETGRTLDVPDLTEDGGSNAYWAKKIVKGGGGMPAFGKKLTFEEINSLVSYIRGLKK